MTQQYDAVIVGAGINSLVAAARLGGAGKSVLLLEKAEKIGGFIDSGEIIEPGFTHDTFSSWHPLFLLSAAYAEFGQELHSHGLEYCNTTTTVTASLSTTATGQQRTAMAYRDPELTAQRLSDPADADAYMGMLGNLDRWGPTIFGVLGSELTPWKLAKIGRAGLKTAKLSGMLELLHQAIMTGRNYTRSTFNGWEVDQLWTPWLLHAGLGPDGATGGIMFPVMAGSMHQAGLPIVKGGATNFIAAFTQLLESRGVQIRTGAHVESIQLDGDKAVAVTTTDGQRYGASEGIFASVGATTLYRDMLPDVPALADARKSTAKFQPGRGAIQIHLTLDGPVPWLDEELRTTPLIHISNGSDSTAVACAQAEAGLLPSQPTIVVGQQSLLDPSRAPEGAATLWLQLQEAPYHPVGDAAGEIPVNGTWDEELKTRYLERVRTMLEPYAPGLSSLIRGVKVISPQDLEAANPNAINGDPYGGNAEIFQNLLWRPMGGATGWDDPVKNLYHIGAANHPGPGLGAGSGFLASEKLLSTANKPAASKLLQLFTK